MLDIMKKVRIEAFSGTHTIPAYSLQTEMSWTNNMMNKALHIELDSETPI